VTSDAIQKCDEIIRHHSKSFSLASRLLPAGVRERAVVVYAWCRRADDAVDLAPDGEQSKALSRLRNELEGVYTGRPLDDPVLSVFQQVVGECGIHRSYAEDLLAGMEMDVEGVRYDDMATFLKYCYCVAGTVGLMMCHVMGVSDERATRNAVHMGMAMQITNICRDVLEDWERGRLYIPDEILSAQGCAGLSGKLGAPFPREAREPVARATNVLLGEADRYYESGDRGLYALSWRCALSIRTARKVYSSIGAMVKKGGSDPLAGRAYVPTSRKILLAAGALAISIAEIPTRTLAMARSRSRIASPSRCLTFPEDVLPV
jgi:phytoene synthase